MGNGMPNMPNIPMPMGGMMNAQQDQGMNCMGGMMNAQQNQGFGDMGGMMGQQAPMMNGMMLGQPNPAMNNVNNMNAIDMNNMMAPRPNQGGVNRMAVLQMMMQRVQQMK